VWRAGRWRADATGTFFPYTTISKSSGGDFCFNIYLFISVAWFRLKFVSFANRLTAFWALSAASQQHF